MPYINLNRTGPIETNSPNLMDGVKFAHSAVQFASLALTAGRNGWIMPQLHLYALAIELAFKSLAIRSGASINECRGTRHYLSKMIALIEKHGTTVSMHIKTRLSDDSWFRSFLLLSRYPAMSELNTSLENTIFLHPDYPEMIAEILEIPCPLPLEFAGGSALAEITATPPPKTPFLQYTETIEERKTANHTPVAIRRSAGRSPKPSV